MWNRHELYQEHIFLGNLIAFILKKKTIRKAIESKYKKTCQKVKNHKIAMNWLNCMTHFTWKFHIFLQYFYILKQNNRKSDWNEGQNWVIIKNHLKDKIFEMVVNLLNCIENIFSLKFSYFCNFYILKQKNYFTYGSKSSYDNCLIFTMLIVQNLWKVLFLRLCLISL